MTESKTAIRWTNIAMFVLLIFIPVVSTIAYGAVDNAAIGILSVFIAGMVLLWIADAIYSGQFRVSAALIQIPLIVLILLGIVQLLPLAGADEADLLTITTSKALSFDPQATRWFIVKALILLVFFAAALAFVRSGERFVKVAAVLISFGAVMSFFGILQRLTDPDAIYGLRPTPQAIPFSSFVNQHHFASFMLMTSGIAFGLALGGALKKDKRIFVWIAIIIMMLGIIFTGSRGGAIGFITTVSVSFLMTSAFKKRRHGEDDNAGNETGKLTAAMLAITVILAVIGTTLFLGAGDDLFRGLGVGTEMADASNGRFHYWGIALKIFGEHPLLGAGLDAYGTAFTRFDTDSGIYRLEYAHNEYLQMLADGGIVGFLCLISFLALLFRSGIALISRSSDKLASTIAIGAFAGCVGIAVHSFFDFPLRTTSNAFFFLLLCALVVNGAYFRKHKRCSRRAI